MRELSNTIFLVLMFQLGTDFICAQPKVGVEATVNVLNRLLDGSDEIAIQGKFLIVRGYNDGVKSKEDKVNKYDLDPKRVKYVARESIVSVKCFDDIDGCVERRSLLVKKKAFRNRIAFSAKDGEHGAKLVRAFEHLFNIFADKKYVGPESLDL